MDIGSPLSFGRGISLVINGKNFPINSTNLDGLPADSISALSELDVDGLIDMDIVTHFDVQFTRNRIHFSNRSIFHANTTVNFPIIEAIIGVPIRTLNIGQED